MNPESRKRAVEVMTGGAIPESTAWNRANKFLDRLLAAGFHVAYWRKVDEAESEDVPFLVSDGSYRWIMNKWPEDIEIITNWLGEDRKPTAIMDLPELPKTEGGA